MQPVTLTVGAFYRFIPEVTASCFETNPELIGTGIAHENCTFKKGRLRSFNRDGHLIFVGRSSDNRECIFHVPIDHKGIYPA